MKKQIITKPNQSLQDIVLQCTGSLENAMQFCIDNDIALTDIPTVGDVYSIPSESESFSNAVLTYLSDNGITVGTLGNDVPVPPPPPPLNMLVVLKPELMASYAGAIPPSTLGYYPIALDASPGFINVNPLGITYPWTNEMNYEDSGNMYSGVLPSLTPETGGSPMTAQHVEYHIPWPGPMGNIYVWNPANAVKTVTFDDVAGNRASSSPVIVLFDHSVGICEYMIADLQVDFVSSDGYTATLRLTRSHATPTNINLVPPYGHLVMTWEPTTHLLYNDPANPGDPDIKLIDLPPGFYTLGVVTNYVNDVLGITMQAYSICRQVIQIF